MRHFIARLANKSPIATALALVLALSGCSSLNPFASKPSPRSTPAPLVEFKSSLNVRTVWSTTIGSAGNYVFTPAVVGDNVYIAAADGALARLDGNTGRVIWRIQTGSKLSAGVGADSNTVVVVGEKGLVLAFDVDGKPRWKTQASSEVLSAPAVGQGTVVVRSVDNRILALDSDSGAKRLSMQRTPPALTLRTALGIVLRDQTAYIAMPGGYLMAWGLGQGTLRWELRVGEPRGATELERVSDMSGMPLLLGTDACTVAYHGRLSCVDANTGAVRWVKDFSSDVGLGGDQRFIFAADENGHLHAFSRINGASIWRDTKLANRHLSTPLSFGRAVAVGDVQGYVHFFSREDGSMLARVATDGSAMTAAPVVVGNTAIFQTHNGMVTGLSIE